MVASDVRQQRLIMDLKTSKFENPSGTITGHSQCSAFVKEGSGGIKPCDLVAKLVQDRDARIGSANKALGVSQAHATIFLTDWSLV